MHGFFAGFAHALRGLSFLLRQERNARVHLGCTLAVIAVGVILKIAPSDWIFVTLAMTGVWVAEGMNTAVERIVDLASPERHPLAGQAKDIAAGATLIAALGAIVVGFFVFVPRLVF